MEMDSHVFKERYCGFEAGSFEEQIEHLIRSPKAIEYSCGTASPACHYKSRITHNTKGAHRAPFALLVFQYNYFSLLTSRSSTGRGQFRIS